MADIDKRFKEIDAQRLVLDYKALDLNKKRKEVMSMLSVVSGK